MLWETATLLLVVAGLLAVPVDLVFLVQRRPSIRGSLSIGWLYGLVRFPVVPGKAKPRPRKPRPRKRAAKRWLPRFLQALRSPAFRRRSLLFFRDLLRSVRMGRLDLRARIGMDDPADTGWLCALAGPPLLLLRTPGAVCDIDFDFTAACLEFQAQGQIRIIPARILGLATLFLLSPATLRTGWEQVRWRR